MAIPDICRIMGLMSADSIMGIPIISSYRPSIDGAPNNIPNIAPKRQPTKPIIIGIRIYPGIMIFLGIPRVLSIAISLAWDCTSL